jgi:SAM-dependent methyltransferase
VQNVPTRFHEDQKMLCPICDSNALTFCGQIQGYRLKSYFNIFECANCGSSHADPRVVDERIYDAIYNNLSKVPGYSRYHNLATRILRERDPLNYIANIEECYFAVRKSLMEKVADKSRTTILEVGCGQGYLTYALARAGFDIIGVDISERAIDLARKRYGNYYYCGSLKAVVEKSCKRPQFIVATELIEHLTDPVLFVSEMLELLGSGGSLILTTPNKLPAGGRIWDTELPPVHLWWLTKNGLIEIAKKLDCEISVVDLKDFYRTHIRYRRIDDGMMFRREPVLNEDYELIQPVPDELLFASMKRKLKEVLPTSFVANIQRMRAGYANYNIVDDETAGTLCVTYARRP